MKTGLDLMLDVLTGDIRLADIKTVGARLLRNADPDVLSLFCGMTGAAPLFTAPQLKALLKKCEPEKAASLGCAVDLAEVLGAEEVLNLHSINDSYRMMRHLARVLWGLDDADPQTSVRYLAYVQHYDGMVKARLDSGVEQESEDWGKLTYAVSVEMQEAGIPPLEAWEGLRNNMSVQQILAVRDHGIPQSVSTGWL